jgi:hypothetical protein
MLKVVFETAMAESLKNLIDPFFSAVINNSKAHLIKTRKTDDQVLIDEDGTYYAHQLSELLAVTVGQPE